MTQTELLILVDENDEPIGTLDKESCHDGQGQRHRAFSIFLFDANGRVLIQERSRHKRLWPRYWSNACCSHPRSGESLEQATQRRLTEELGLPSGHVALTWIYRFEYRAPYFDLGTEHEVCSVFVGRLSEGSDVRLDPDEVVAADWISPEELDSEIATDPQRFSPWIQLEWQALRTQYADSLRRALE